MYIVAYDIADAKRWRRVHGIVEGYGHRLQLSVFQCRLTVRRREELSVRLETVIKHTEDHILLIDLGLAEKVEPRVESIGKTYEAPVRRATIV